jgi:DNA-binding transcriptional ArsR family regulator
LIVELIGMNSQLNDNMIEEIAALFSALGDSSRLKILRALLASNTPLSQRAVSEASGLSQANASKHLACLVRVGLVTRQPEGNTVFYSPVLPLVDTLCGTMCGHASERARAAYKALN